MQVARGLLAFLRKYFASVIPKSCVSALEGRGVGVWGEHRKEGAGWFVSSGFNLPEIENGF
jgi:hypothetical protein